MVFADGNNSTFVPSVESRTCDIISLNNHKLCSTVKGCYSMTCGLNMEMDTHKPFEHMAYLMCDQNRLVRLNLEHINSVNPKATKDKLKAKVLYQSNKHAIFYVAYKHLYVMSDNKLTKIDKISLAAKADYSLRVNIAGEQDITFV